MRKQGHGLVQHADRRLSRKQELSIRIAPAFRYPQTATPRRAASFCGGTMSVTTTLAKNQRLLLGNRNHPERFRRENTAANLPAQVGVLEDVER